MLPSNMVEWRVWESIVEATGWLLTNRKKDQIATNAEFTGNIDKPDVNTWVVIAQLLRNAFIQALYPALENSINLNSVGKKEEKQTFLEKIFEGNKNKKPAKKKNK